MATKMKMVNKGGKMVPAFAADGKGKMKMGGTKKYQDGGKVTRGDIKDAQRAAKLKRIQEGTEPSTYEKVSNIAGSVAKTAGAVAQGAAAVRDVKQGMGGPGMKKGGAVKKMQDGGVKAKAKKVVKAAVKASPEYKTYKAVGKAAKGVDDALEKRYPNYTGKGSAYDGLKQGVKTILGYKTGGMVKANTKISASKVAKGKVGGISKSPKTAVPKAMYGASMKPGMMKQGGMVKKTMITKRMK